MSLSSTWSSMRRLVPLVLGTAALAMVWGRFAMEARHAVVSARSELAAGQPLEATRSYLDALRVYVPGSPYERQALDGLVHMADDARTAGDTTNERRALEAIRTGLLGTRSFIIPHRARLAATEARLRDLDDAEGVRPPVELLAPHGHHGPGRLRDARGPAVLSTLIALVGLATWIAAVALLVRAGIEDRQTDEPPAAVPGAALRMVVPVLFVVGVALFLIGLRFA